MTDELPETLRKIRVLRNFSQEYVAETIGVSLSSYARYETGKVEIDFYSVAKLAALYKMGIDELVHYGDPDFKVDEPEAHYKKRPKVTVMIELDGLENTLDNSIERLRRLNAAI